MLFRSAAPTAGLIDPPTTRRDARSAWLTLDQRLGDRVLLQDAFEAIVEMLYDTLEEIVGPKMVAKIFSLLATLFIFILTANWFGLLPGVGSIGFGVKTGFLTLSEVKEPLLRPATADLNMTLAMALIFFALAWWRLPRRFVR